MGEVETIRRLYHVKGHGIRRIARDLGVSRNTVRCVLRGDHDGRYTRSKTRARPAVGRFVDQVRGWLKAEKDSEVWSKQRLTAARVYELLCKEPGFSASEASVRRLVRELRQELGQAVKEAFVPLAYDPGVDAQVDFFEADVRVGGVRVRLSFLLMRACYSKRLYLRRVPAENQEALFETLMAAFAYFGGVFQCLWFDNLSAGIDRVLRGRGRLVNRRFEQFRQHYAFVAEWCAPGRGNEKGGVEHGVKYVRRRALTPVLEVRDLAELDRRLEAWMAGENRRGASGSERDMASLWAEERDRLIPLPAHDYDSGRPAQRRVSNYSLVALDTNFYSVPVALVGAQLTVKSYSDRIDIHGRCGLVATHRRLYGRNQTSFDLMHYLPLLTCKTRAFDRAAPVRQARTEWPPAYELLLRSLRQRRGEVEGTREFIEVLQLHRRHPTQRMHEAVRRAVTRAEPSVWSVAACADALERAEQPAEILSAATTAHLPVARVDTGNVRQYEQLCQGRQS